MGIDDGGHAIVLRLALKHLGVMTTLRWSEKQYKASTSQCLVIDSAVRDYCLGYGAGNHAKP